MIKISYIIPMYNAEKFIAKCISSIKEQDVPSDEYEIIVINDGSKDGSLKKAEECLADIKYSQLLTQENQGQASARNKGIAIAKGKYIMFVDADDWLLHDTIGKLLECAEEYQTEITMSSCRVVNHEGKYSIDNDYPHFDIITDGESALMNGLVLGSVWCRLFLKAFIIANNLSFQTGIKHEDVLFSINCAIKANRIISKVFCTYVYCWNEGSTDRSFDYENFQKAILSDLYIANEIIGIAERGNIKFSLRNNLRKRANSIIVGNIINLAKSPYKRDGIVDTYLKKGKEYGCYPIKGRTLSWKTTALIPLINQEWLLRRLL